MARKLVADWGAELKALNPHVPENHLKRWSCRELQKKIEHEKRLLSMFDPTEDPVRGEVILC